MLVLLLTYSFRKRLRILGNSGNIRNWLNFHIYLGISGPIFIILHSSLKLNGLVSISFWSMIAVALSGALGRYLYIQIPRTMDGNELTIEDVKTQLKILSLRIQTDYALDDNVNDRVIQTISGNLYKGSGRVSALRIMLFADILSRRQVKKVKRALRTAKNINKRKLKSLLLLIRQKYLLERRIIFWHAIHELFHYWHVVHKPFAIIMYIIMLVHIGISIWLGYTWIL